MLDDTAYVERTLDALERLGVRVVLDDFGVGFSSLGYLKRLPLSMVKLDRTFVENVTDSAFDAAVVRAVSDMAETIGIGVVAEGVETDEQVRVARDLGCGYAQGFHFAEPVPASSVERLLARPMPVSPDPSRDLADLRTDGDSPAYGRTHRRSPRMMGCGQICSRRASPRLKIEIRRPAGRGRLIRDGTRRVLAVRRSVRSAVEQASLRHPD